jgi:hypothetical protein
MELDDDFVITSRSMSASPGHSRRSGPRLLRQNCAISGPATFQAHEELRQGFATTKAAEIHQRGSLFVIVFALRSAEFLGESDEKPFRPADVAEPIRVFILDYFAYELRAALAEPFKRLVDVVHGEHDAEVA